MHCSQWIYVCASYVCCLVDCSVAVEEMDDIFEILRESLVISKFRGKHFYVHFNVQDLLRIIMK